MNVLNTVGLPTATLIFLMASVLIPSVSALLAKSTWSEGVVGVLTLVLAAVGGFFTEWSNAGDGFNWKGAIGPAVVGFMIAVASHFGLLKNTPTQDKLRKAIWEALMSITLPSYVKTGRVLGRQIMVGSDTAGDVDTAPDAAFIVGAAVTFEPSVYALVFPTDHDTIYPQTVNAVVGSDGLPKTANGDELWLIASKGQTDNDQDWFWNVTVKNGLTRYPTFRMDVTYGVDNYLSDAQPIPATTVDSAVVRGPAGPTGPAGPSGGAAVKTVATTVTS